MSIQEKRVSVELSDGKEVKLVVKAPTTGISSRSDRIRAKVWTECVQDGIMTKKELARFMREKGIWDDQKDAEQLEIGQKLVELEQKLFIKKGRSSKVKAEEGKKLALQMRILRLRLRELVSERVSLENNTAEALADNAKFDFLVSACTYYENDQKVYNSLEEYINSSNSEIAFTAASALASMLYNLDQGFESRLPENKFLKMFGFCDDELSLVDTEGHRVDLQGRKINERGQLINDEGVVMDSAGNLLDEDGNYVPTVTYVDNKGKKITPNG
jgi:hypothetical protein